MQHVLSACCLLFACGRIALAIEFGDARLEQLLRARLGALDPHPADTDHRQATVLRNYDQHLYEQHPYERDDTFNQTNDVDDDDDDDHERPAEWHIYTQIGHSYSQRRNAQFIRFDISNLPTTRHVATATLHLSVAHADSQPTNSCTVSYGNRRTKFDVSWPAAVQTSAARHSSMQLDVLYILDTWRSTAQSSGLVSVQLICAGEDDPTRLAIRRRSHNGPLRSSSPPQIRLTRADDETDAAWAQHQPTLVVRTSAAKARRNRRAATTARKRFAPPNIASMFAGRPRAPSNCIDCNMHTHYVDFVAIGWDAVVIAPAGVNFTVCKGNCRQPRDQRPPNNALVQAELKRVKPGDHMNMNLACVPIRRDSITLLTRTSRGQIVQSEFADLVVRECGCR